MSPRRPHASRCSCRWRKRGWRRCQWLARLSIESGSWDPTTCLHVTKPHLSEAHMLKAGNNWSSRFHTSHVALQESHSTSWLQLCCKWSPVQYWPVAVGQGRQCQWSFPLMMLFSRAWKQGTQWASKLEKCPGPPASQLHITRAIVRIVSAAFELLNTNRLISLIPEKTASSLTVQLLCIRAVHCSCSFLELC